MMRSTKNNKMESSFEVEAINFKNRNSIRWSVMFQTETPEG
jgi:hypothetical protein